MTERIDRWPEIRISCPSSQGFIVWSAGDPIAAMTSRAELADWIERHLGDIPGEREREAEDLASTQEALSNVERFPTVIEPRTEVRRKGLWGRS